MRIKKSRDRIVKRVDRTEAEKLQNGYLDMLQTQAANEFYELTIKSQFGQQGMDPSVEKVDGGKLVEIPNIVLHSRGRLAIAAKAIGKKNAHIIYRFTVDGWTAAMVAKEEGESGDRACKYWRRRYRDALTELANHWYHVTGSRQSRIKAVMVSVIPFVYQDTGN